MNKHTRNFFGCIGRFWMGLRYRWVMLAAVMISLALLTGCGRKFYQL